MANFFTNSTFEYISLTWFFIVCQTIIQLIIKGSPHKETCLQSCRCESNLQLKPSALWFPSCQIKYRDNNLTIISILTATKHNCPASFNANRPFSAPLLPLAVVFSLSQRSGRAPQFCGCWPAGWYISINWWLSNFPSLPHPLHPSFFFSPSHYQINTKTHGETHIHTQCVNCTGKNSEPRECGHFRSIILGSLLWNTYSCVWAVGMENN